jgi:hypothetical protein
MVGQQGRWSHMNLEGLIPLLGGVYFLLVGLRVLRVSKNPEANELWLRKFGTWMKIIGPILIIFGLADVFGVFR